MSMYKVFGHIHPDTDSTCSAIAYTWYLNERLQPALAYLLGSPNKEALFVLKRFKQDTPPVLNTLAENEEVIIVDTNNPEELPGDFGKVVIKEIVDHHKLFGGLKSSEPITMTLRPVACTATVIWEIMQENKVTPPAEIAGLMLSAIISDTLKFSSPTTTEKDKEAASGLAEIAGVDINELAEAMFEAKSDLTGMSNRDILLVDSKVMRFGNFKVRVSTLETTNPAKVLERQAELEKEMQVMKEVEDLEGAFFFTVDILNNSSTLIVPDKFEKEAAEAGFEQSFDGSRLALPGVVSRKKQMLPALEKGLTD